jgi:uncharacterized repeat protein (TIGR03803 family)
MNFAQLKRRLSTMTNQQSLPTFTLACTLFAALALALVFARPASAQTESVLYSNFVSGSGVGGGPYTGLIADSAGNLYGAAGSDMWNGAAYELIPSAGGIWTLKILHEFTASDGVGASAGFTMDAAGNLYAADLYGGNGYGSIFELKPISNGTWKVQILYKFVNNGTDGHYPGATLTMDAAGNLYGTTQEGGLKNVGVVFELTPYAGGGGWSEKILSSLPYKQKHWADTDYPLTLDSAGNLYGVTNIGGANDGGFVFKLSPTSKGPWTLTTLYSFGIYTGPAPAVPWSGVVFDSAGNLYGVTALGGTEASGTVYQLSPSSGGGWTEKDLVDFPASCSPACIPEAAITVDSAGNIFGTASATGSFGVAYEVSPNGSGTWALNILHNFEGGTDGSYPNSGAMLNISGKLYGTTREGGGTKGRGTVFEITP